MSPREEAILADRAEETALVDMYDAAPTALKAQLGLRVERIGGATGLIAPRTPTTMFYRVISLDLNRPATVEDLEALRRLYRDDGAGTWWLHRNPFAAPEGGPPWPAAEGFTLPAMCSCAKMLRASAERPRITTDLGLAEANDA